MKYKQIKKIGVEGFSKTFRPNIFYLLKKKRLKLFGAIFLPSIFAKNTWFVFGHLIESQPQNPNLADSNSFFDLFSVYLNIFFF